MAQRKVEVFTAGCPACEPVVEMVQSLVCSSCDVQIHNVASNQEAHAKITEYGVSSLPAVVIDGKLLATVNKDTLTNAGVGKPMMN